MHHSSPHRGREANVANSPPLEKCFISIVKDFSPAKRVHLLGIKRHLAPTASSSPGSASADKTLKKKKKRMHHVKQRIACLVSRLSHATLPRLAFSRKCSFF
ncbi:hypothetical protein CDAR_96541 [Caerostris darwini]|uniref:Uncharacterized protein n=1 Tax=Caerostris darwini TaxID=1538125 RepID=A0AAV4QXI6_9ARAC|nr:hypothetical protein CDAR_96541 [Caerostris darwini]